METKRKRLAAVRAATAAIRPALMRFYETLDQGQKVRFAGMSYTKTRCARPHQASDGARSFPNSRTSAEDMVKGLNRMLVGWAKYYRRRTKEENHFARARHGVLLGT
jgi:hypothetical protein